jgi:hypothetical protein
MSSMTIMIRPPGASLTTSSASSVASSFSSSGGRLAHPGAEVLELRTPGAEVVQADPGVETLHRDHERLERIRAPEAAGPEMTNDPTGSKPCAERVVGDAEHRHPVDLRRHLRGEHRRGQRADLGRSRTPARDSRPARRGLACSTAFEVPPSTAIWAS